MLVILTRDLPNNPSNFFSHFQCAVTSSGFKRFPVLHMHISHKLTVIPRPNFCGGLMFIEERLTPQNALNLYQQCLNDPKMIKLYISRRPMATPIPNFSMLRRSSKKFFLQNKKNLRCLFSIIELSRILGVTFDPCQVSLSIFLN